MNRTIVAHTPLGSQLLFKKMLGTESVSNLFEFNITLVSPNPNLQGKDIIGQFVTLEIDTEASSPRYLNGLVTDFGYIGEDEDEEGYHALLVPLAHSCGTSLKIQTAGFSLISPY